MTNYVIRHGRRIAVKTIDTGILVKPKRRPKDEPFAIVPLAEAAAAFGALKCPVALVWIVLRYERWRQKSNTIRLPTTLLRSWGLDRWAWGRALASIERAGLVHVERRPGRAARVTFADELLRHPQQ